MRSALAFSITVSLCFGLACSSFRSSSSPSRWSSESFKASSSPSRWSSESSGDDAAPEEEVEADEAADVSAYERDLRNATVSTVTSGGQSADILSSIYPIAHEHGITDYDGDPATYRAIGRGLGVAEVSFDDFERFQAQLAGGSDVRRQLLLEGYTSAR